MRQTAGWQYEVTIIENIFFFSGMDFSTLFVWGMLPDSFAAVWGFFKVEGDWHHLKVNAVPCKT